MRILGFATAVCFLYTSSLPAQNINGDSAILTKQHSEWKQALAEADRKLADRQKLYLEVQSKKPHYDTLGLGQYRFTMAQFKNERRQQEIAFIREHPNYKISVEALKDAIGALPEDILIYDKLFRGLDKDVRKSEDGAALRKIIDGYMAVRIGAEAPLFEASDTAGQTLHLKDLRGKYVLLDFWASWCMPCREENPNVVKAYEQFKDKNFTVLGISLDQPGKRDAWIKAIKSDGLVWDHVSDLKYWNNAVAKLYSIRSIPQNFLLDPHGKIVAANLRGEALLQKLQELLQKDSRAPAAIVKDTIPKTDSGKNFTAGQPKRYGEVITKKAISKNGLFRVHQIDEQYFFEIPDSLLNRDILVVNRISRAPAGLRPQVNVYAGDEIAENVIRFEKGPFNRLFMRRMLFQEKSADSTENGMYRAVVNSSLQPIVAAFPIKALGMHPVPTSSGDSSGGGTYVIDVTSFLQSENEIFYFGPEAKKGLSLGPVQNDKSYVACINTFPINVEVRSVRTYLPTTQGSTLPTTYEINSSLVLLPKTPMKPRYADARVGFFSRGVIDFDAEPQRVTSKYYVTRWRLEPKPEDRAKYLRGELVEPQTPIVYYIDPATPRKWVPYLIAGVNDWQKAFEQAGFKNAIKALPAPENDSTWSIDDARHNVIVYKPSSIANASGPHVHDPRSGEIIETHINWYHNIMTLIHDWYMIQAGAIDPRARSMQFDDELMGQLIRFVSSHEVGHTLGLMHNYGSSSTVPVEKLRDKKYVEQYGHTPSIMDYARFNYVAQPEDSITEKGIFPRIGAYDRWAIQWGYRWLPQFDGPDAETPYLNKLVIDSLNHNRQLFFGFEMDAFDPRSQSEDLGDDAVMASTYGIKNLRRILPKLSDWTRMPNEGYESLKSMNDQLFRQYNLYMAHVLKSVGGQYTTQKSVEQNGPVFEPVSYEKQKGAMKFLDTYLFHIPDWLADDTTFMLTGSSPDPYFHTAQYNALSRLMGSGMLIGFIKNETRYKHKKVYSCAEFLDDLKKSVWGELYSRKPIDLNRRDLQRMYIDNAFIAFRSVNEIVGRNSGNGIQFYINPDPTKADVAGLMRAHLLGLRKDIKNAIPLQSGLSKDHLENIVARIDKALKDGEWVFK